jgi:hypothetical protein
MSSKVTNPLTGNAEQSAVCRSSEGKNQGKASCIVLAISSVRSAVYRSFEEMQYFASLFFYPRYSFSFFCIFADRFVDENCVFGCETDIKKYFFNSNDYG